MQHPIYDYLEVLMEAETEKTYCHLDQVERERIGLGLLGGESLRMIAAALGRSPSSISRERRRNGCAAGYIACVAEQSAVKRASV
ncbi:MAG: helix-turn-helix domain-containing protein, partial [Burkholderiales bacterium]|nr:helix-turn-helix domain-containing protein [Rhodocyclaceae bacterium]MCA3044961.1 helix-turn-helix domain-containing protein [Rhodocyclaceae bacterium]MCA3079695.1 helix-turn-helix domain-containing protein [Rhodocyclaceae bacterium]